MTTYQPLKEISRSTRIWKIRVRVTRMWRSTSDNQKDGKEISIDMTLLDEHGGSIHARIMDDSLRGKFKNRIEEGKIYQIHNFSIQPAKEFRPVRHDFIIYFRRDTTLKPITEDDQHIPKYKFDFVDFAELSSRSGMRTYTQMSLGS